MALLKFTVKASIMKVTEKPIILWKEWKNKPNPVLSQDPQHILHFYEWSDMY